jgi:5-methylcytosine-specific restriction protein A
MPRRIGYHRAPGPPASRLYQRQASRMEDNRFYASAAWRRLRAAFLAENPVCTRCSTTLAAHAHHVLPRKTHPELALDWDNLAARCAPCHNAEEER